jgi:hypothetical protein
MPVYLFTFNPRVRQEHILIIALKESAQILSEHAKRDQKDFSGEVRGDVSFDTSHFVTVLYSELLFRAQKSAYQRGFCSVS